MSTPLHALRQISVHVSLASCALAFGQTTAVQSQTGDTETVAKDRVIEQVAVTARNVDGETRTANTAEADTNQLRHHPRSPAFSGPVHFRGPNRWRAPCMP